MAKVKNSKKAQEKKSWNKIKNHEDRCCIASSSGKKKNMKLYYCGFRTSKGPATYSWNHGSSGFHSSVVPQFHVSTQRFVISYTQMREGGSMVL